MKDGVYGAGWQMSTVGGGNCRGWTVSSGETCSYGICYGSYLDAVGYLGINNCGADLRIACVSG
jgi:hypothetical protein